MSKKITGVLLAILTAALVYFLNTPKGGSPALGLFLSPTHGIWKNAVDHETSNSTEEIKCIKGIATIVYDEFSVPHIFAENEEDLIYALGYTEAKDRLWQMEFQMYAAAGRLTELVGEKALPLDRFTRRIGIVRAAKNSLSEIEKNPVSKRIVDNFTAGVNAYIRQLSDANLPIEYKLIGYKPEPWTPLKCALLTKYMAKDLTYYDTDVENTNALRIFGATNYKKMFPDFPPPSIDPVIPRGTKWNFKSVDSLSVNSKNLAFTALYKNPYKFLYANPNYGSNNWTVNGTKTKSGKPILCGDPHLGLNLPSIWYEVQMTCPGLNVYGVTIPGAPGVIIGHNDNIAWSVTNSERDVINNYSVEYQDASRKTYKLGGQFIPFEYDVQTYTIRGGKTFIDSIRITKAGAIVYDENFGEQNDQKHIATYWRAEEPSNETMAFYYLDHAKNHQDYLNALEYYACPGQNFIYADKDNNIAIRQQGNFLLRTREGDGSFVTPLAEIDLRKLKARIPSDQNPYILNPARGFCSSANQNPVDSSYPYLTNGHYENYRNRVINTELTNGSQLNWEDMGKLQNNTLSLLAKEVLPTLLANITPQSDATAKKIVSTLASWNYYTTYTSVAPSYFYKLWEEIEKITYDEMDSKDISLRIPESYVTANLIIREPDFTIFDLQKTNTRETATDIINAALKSTAQFFRDNEQNTTLYSQWQHFKNTRITHLALLNAFSVKDIPIGGNHNIVNAASDKWGPSWRMIVDFSGGKPQCYGIYPGGQSGNPGNKGYTAFVEKWAKGEYCKLHFFSTKEEALKSIKN